MFLYLKEFHIQVAVNFKIIKMSEIETENMDIHHTSYLTIILSNVKWLLVFLFTPVINYMIVMFPDWKDSLENFKLIGGSIIIVLVILKLLLEIFKLIFKKDK